MGMQKITVSMTEEMVKALEVERRKKMLSSVPEVIRQIVGEFIQTKGGT